MGIRFEVTHEPTVSTKDLAIHLAESLQGVMDAERDAAEYLRQIQTENQKLSQLRFTIDQVKRHRKSNPVQTSRMDPMFEYDLDALKLEAQECKDRAAEWSRIREENLLKAAELKRKSTELQLELKERSKKEG